MTAAVCRTIQINLNSPDRNNQPNQTYSRHSLVHPHLSLVSLCVECGEERVLERRVLSRPLQVAVHFAHR